MTGLLIPVASFGSGCLITAAILCLVAERIFTAPANRPSRFSAAGLACCALALVPVGVLLGAAS